MADQLSLIPDRPFAFNADALSGGRQGEAQSLQAPGRLVSIEDGDTMAHRCARFFRQRPGVWVDGRALMSVCGGYAWRTRIADCRRLFGMIIENRQRLEGRTVISEYRWVPPDADERPAA